MNKTHNNDEKNQGNIVLKTKTKKVLIFYVNYVILKQYKLIYGGKIMNKKIKNLKMIIMLALISVITLTNSVIAIDTVEPVVSISGITSATSVTNGGSLTFTVNYTDDVGILNSSLNLGDITLNGFTASKTVTRVNASQYTINLTNVQGIGSGKSVTIAANTAWDAANNKNTSLTSRAFTIVAAAPTDTVEPVVSINGITSATSIEKGGSLTFTVNYTDDVAITSSNLTSTAITLNGFTATKAVTKISNTQYTVTLTNIQGTGTGKSVTIAANTASDAAGNKNAALTSRTFEVVEPTLADTVNPVVSINGITSSTSIEEGKSLIFTVIYTDDVAVTGSNLTESAVTLNGFTANKSITKISNTQYTVTLTNLQGTGSGKSVTIAANTAWDAAGNKNAALTSRDFVVVAKPDTTAPTIVIYGPNPGSIYAGETVVYTAVFADDIGITNITLGASNIRLVGFTANISVSGTGNTRTITLTNVQGTIDSNKSITVLAGAAVDAAGNKTPLATSNKFSILEPRDTIAPVANISGIYSGMKVMEGDSFTATVKFTDNKAVVNSSLTLNNLKLHGFTATTTITNLGNHEYKLTFTNVKDTAGVNYITVASSVAADAAGNKNLSASSREFIIVTKDTVVDKLPTVSIQGPNPASIYVGEKVTYTVIFADDKGISKVNLTKDYITLRGFTANISVTGTGNTRTITLSNIQGTAGTAKYITISAASAIDTIGQRTPQAVSNKFTIKEKTLALKPIVTKYTSNCIDDLSLLGDINKEITYFASWLRAEKYTASYVQENNYVANGEKMTYMVEYYNGSTAPAPNVVFELTIPYKVDIEEINGGGKITSQTDRETVITWYMGNIPTGAYCRLYVRVRFNENTELKNSSNISEIFYPTLKTTAGGNYSYSYLRQLFIDLTEGKTGTYKSYLLSFDTSNLIRPDDEITRAEFAKLLADAGLIQVKTGDTAYKTFKDADKIPAYARDAVSALVGTDIIQAFSDGAFKPDYPILMEDAMQMLAQAARYVSDSKLTINKPVFLYTNALKGKDKEVSPKKDYIMELMRQNVIVKYESNPDSYALRKDVVKMVNALTFRGPFVESLPTSTSKFSDIRDSSLTFYDIIGASNSYKYVYDYRLWQEITEIIK